MKIVLDVEDKSYQTILDFISLLPENQCRVLNEETNEVNLQIASKNKRFPHKSNCMALPIETTLLVALTIKPKPELSEDLQKHLNPKFDKDNKYPLGYDFYTSKLSVNTQFVEVTISDPTAIQKDFDDKGGVYLEYSGLIQTGISTSSIKLPIQKEDGKCIIADSLNHAFTLLSIQYEPWRKSHTGNIYDRILYQEKNGKWYPIDVLRNVISIKKEEHQLVFEARQKAMETILSKKNAAKQPERDIFTP